jgi:protease I
MESYMRMIARCLLAAFMFCTLSGIANARPSASDAGVPHSAVGATGAPPPHAELVRFLLQGVEDPERLKGYRVAILAADGVDGFDLEVPRMFLTERGATVHVVVPRSPQVLQATGSGARVRAQTHISVLEPSGEEETAGVDRFVDQVQADDYDAIYLPANRASIARIGGAQSVAFLQQAMRSGRPIFAIGNSPLVLLEAGLLDDKRATGDVPTLQRLAGSRATIADAPLVSDGLVHTSRNAFDMPALLEWLVATLLTQPAQEH